MLKISTITEGIVRTSDFAVQGLQDNVLNLSAYAKSIQKEVSEKTMKDVQVSTIVVALSRIQKRLKKEPRFLPRIEVENIAIKPGLVEMVFARNPHSIKALQKLYRNNKLLAEHLTVTYGINEISIIILKKRQSEILKIFAPLKPTLEIQNIASIALRVNPKYTYTKNTFYALLKILAPRGINVIELLTTSTEISFLVEEKDWEKTFSIFNELFKNSLEV